MGGSGGKTRAGGAGGQEDGDGEEGRIALINRALSEPNQGNIRACQALER